MHALLSRVPFALAGLSCNCKVDRKFDYRCRVGTFEYVDGVVDDVSSVEISAVSRQRAVACTHKQVR